MAAEHKSGLRVWLAAVVLIMATVAAYHRTFSAPFVFDDPTSIPLNSTIPQFGAALTPPNTNGETVSGRPLVNLSLAVNYAISGTLVWNCHALNLLIHAAAGLTLLELMRRTFLLPSSRGHFGNPAEAFAFIRVHSRLKTVWCSCFIGKSFECTCDFLIQHSSADRPGRCAAASTLTSSNPANGNASATSPATTPPQPLNTISNTHPWQSHTQPATPAPHTSTKPPQIP